MKKLLLSGSALLLSFGLANAQGWTSTGAHDDFATNTEYADIDWDVDANFTLTRPGDFTLNLETVGNIGGNGNSAYPNFSVTTASMDLSAGANIEIDIENATSSLLVMKIELEDGDGDKSDIEPNVSDVTAGLGWGDQVNSKYPRKANNGLVLAAGGRGTFVIDLSSVPGVIGGLTRIGWVGDAGCTTNGPICGPVTEYRINPADIVAVYFTVNYGNDGQYIISQGDGDHTADYIVDPGNQAAALNGDLIIHSFKIGSSATTSVKGSSEINSSLKVYPNPANDALTVSFDATTGADITLSDLTGFNVYTASANSGSNNITVNTSNLASGLYILNVATEKGNVSRKVTIE